MIDRYRGYSLTRLYTEIGDRSKVMDIYLQLYPKQSIEAVKERLDGEDHDRALPIFELYCVRGRFLGGYNEDEAVADYLAMHPEAKEADLRAELQRALKQADEEYDRRFGSGDK